MNLGSALKKSYTKAQRSVTKAIDAPPTVVLPNVDPSLLDSADEFGSQPVSLTNDAQLEQIMGRRKSLIDQRAGLTPPGAVEPKTDTRSLWIAGGLGLLGALLNKGNNGTRQSGMRAMQNVLGGAQNTANRKAQMAAQKSMQDYNAALAKNQAELEKAMLDAATVNGRISADNAAAIARQKQANLDRQYELDARKQSETERRNLSVEELNAYKATPQFKRDYDAQIQMGVPPAQAEAHVLAKFQQDINRAFLIKAQTANTEQMTKLRPIIEQNKQDQFRALFGQRENQFNQTMDWKRDSFNQERLDKIAAADAKLQADSTKKQASLYYDESGWPKYGGYTRAKQVEEVDKKIAQLSKMPNADGMLGKGGKAVSNQDQIAYWFEIKRKIVNGIPLAKDPWGIWVDPAKVKQGPNDPLLPGVGAKGTITLRGPIGR